MIRHHLRLFSLLPALSLVSAAGTVRAQGIPSARSDIVLPNSQSAAIEDATALLVNPAGLSLVEGLELSAGAFARTDGQRGTSDFDAALATSPAAGLGFGFGGGLHFGDGTQTQLRTSAGVAAAAGPSASLGGAIHGDTRVTGGIRTDWFLDVGAQLRPARWLALGFVLEGIGEDRTGTTGRVGLSLRPLQEMLTVGIDARVVPGSRDPGSSRYLGAASVVPGVVARLDLGGLGLSLGASLQNLGFVTAAPPSLEVLASVEMNGTNLGATLLGGAGGLFDGTLGGVGGARLRGSSARWTPLLPERGRWLGLALRGDGVAADKDEGGIFSLLFGEEPQALTVLAALENAAEDPAVEGVVVELQGLTLGWARLTELRAALTKLREGGKKVVVHLASGDDGDVFLASAADRVYLVPAGYLELNGLRAEMTYLGDTLEKIGVRAEAVSAGKYKSAPRTFTSNEPSPEELEVEAAILDGIWATLTRSIAEGRKLTVDEVKAVIDRGGLTGAEAVEAKMVDGLAYPDEIDARVEELAGHPVQIDKRFLGREDRLVRWDAPARIALIPVEGTIAMQGGGGLLGAAAGADDLVEAIEHAANDSDVRAIVLRIDSPGGDALASDLIWRAVMKAREKKPVVASMGDVAASGGYYVAAAAHTILAEPNTITGSIGVFGLLFNAERLADDIGVRTYPIERGALPGPSIFRSLADAERASLQRSVDGTYERFLDAIVAGRGASSGLDKEALRSIAEGRVWLGEQALERKLVDRTGSLLEAIDEARARAELPDGEAIELEVLTGGGGALGGLTAAVRALGGTTPAGVAQAVRMLLGDPEAAAFLVAHEGRPLAVSPIRLRIEESAR